jgi:hypothetical protein
VLGQKLIHSLADKDDNEMSSLPAELRTATANSKVSTSIKHHSALSWMQWLANKSKMASSTTEMPQTTAKSKTTELTTTAAVTSAKSIESTTPVADIIHFKQPYPG